MFAVDDDKHASLGAIDFKHPLATLSMVRSPCPSTHALRILTALYFG